MAIQIIREITADVVKRGSTRAVYAKQHDFNSRFLNVRIQEDGQDIQVAEGLTVILNVVRPDKQGDMFYGTVNTDGTVKVPLTAWMLELEGTLVCDISIVSEDPAVARLTTMQFNIYVEASTVPSGVVEETEDYNVIVDLLTRTTEAEAKASSAAASAEYLREQCEQATQEATTAAANANKTMQELNDTNRNIISDELAKRAQLKPEFANGIEECTDQSKLYVLPDGNIYAYVKNTRYVENNEYDPSASLYNCRLKGADGSVVACQGALVTKLIELPYDPDCTVTISGISELTSVYGSYFVVDYYDASQARLPLQRTNEYFGVTNGNVPVTFKIFKPSNGLEDPNRIAYVRIRLGIAPEGTSITAGDCIGLTINFPSKNATVTDWQWANTGHAFVPADYEDRIVDLETQSTKHEDRITVLENQAHAGGEVTVPTFWQNAVDEAVAKIKALQVGKNCVTFPFFSDNHQRNGYAGILISHIMKECGIPFCFYGGDTISSGYLNESDMLKQDKAFDNIMSCIPDGRFCRAVGNHDGFWNDNGSKSWYTREQVYELFLRAEGVAQNKHYGEDGTYYYVDDIACKVRFIVLNTNAEEISAGNEGIDSVQLAWLQSTALSFEESGWGAVIISHCPISNHYHANVVNATEVISVVNNSGADIIGWYSGHIHRDRMYTHSAVGSADGVEGTDGTPLGFTEVTITSDHTSIAYDDATKHTVANDDLSHAIDFVTINKTTRTVNITRLGIGNDRNYTY